MHIVTAAPTTGSPPAKQHFQKEANGCDTVATALTATALTKSCEYSGLRQGTPNGTSVNSRRWFQKCQAMDGMPPARLSGEVC